MSENGQALDAIRTNVPGTHYLGSAHTLANFETAFYRSDVTDNNSFEQWQEDGSLDAAQRANAIWKKMLAEYEAPPIDPASTRRCSTSSPGARRRCRTPRSRPVLFRRRSSLTPARSAALAGVLARPDLRARAAEERARPGRVPAAGATVSVTASPAKGIEATVALCEQLQARGFRAVPHLSARMIRDRGHLPSSSPGSRAPASIARSSSVATPRSPVTTRTGCRCCARWPRSVIRSTEIGIPAYPQGHAFIADGPLLEALRAKAAFASYMTTQLCFDPDGDRDVARARRAEGIDAAGPRRPAGRRRAAAAARDQRPDRGRRHAPVPGQEHAVHRPADPVRRFLPARRPARRARAARRRARRTASSTCTCTRSTRSTSPSAGGRHTSSGCRVRRRLSRGRAHPCRAGAIGHHGATTEEFLSRVAEGPAR